MRCDDSLRVQAYFDGELDALSAADIERHRELCAECGALLADLERVRDTLRQELPYVSTPPALRARVMRALDQERKVQIPRLNAERLTSWRPRPFWKGAFSGIGGTAIAASIAFFLLAPPLANPLLEDLVSAHVRSLMPDHLIDVVSTDKSPQSRSRAVCGSAIPMCRRWSPTSLSKAIDSSADVQIILIINAQRWSSTSTARTSSMYLAGRARDVPCRTTQPSTAITSPFGRLKICSIAPSQIPRTG